MRFKKAVFVDLWKDLYDRNQIYPIIAMLRRHGVEVDYRFASDPKTALSEVTKANADLILYSAFSAHVPLFINFDALLKRKHPRAYSILGGCGVNDPASRRRLQASTIDAVCVGEGDLAIDEFLRTGGECRANLVRSKDLLEPRSFNPYAVLDDLPFPDREPVYRRDSLRAAMPSKHFMGSRGCPYDCTYCHNHVEHELFKGCGPHVRLKSVDYFLEEIRQIQRKYPLKTVVIQDDVFFVNRKWGFEFCERFPREVGVPFTCNVRSDLMNDDVVRAMKAGGCKTVAWAIESGDPEVRKVLGRKTSDENILATGELFNKYGIKHRINNIIGVPGETYEQMLKTLDLNLRAKPTLASAWVFVPFDGLKLTETAIAQGHLGKEGVKELPTTFLDKTTLNYSPKDKVRLKKLVYNFPIMSRYPFLYRNLTMRNLILNRLPSRFLAAFSTPVQILGWARMYLDRPDLLTTLRIAGGYFSGRKRG